MNVLGIETSCDETAAAIVQDGRIIKSSVVASQIELHAPFHGVVPEIASRAHLDCIHQVIDSALAQGKMTLQQIDGIAVTNRPGLIGSLLVGLTTAKTLAFYYHKPFVGIDHIQAHIYSTVMDNPQLQYPFISLIVSGGHTALFLAKNPNHAEILGETLDDACGEAFDKVAAVLGLSYPGGPAIEKVACHGDAKRFPFKAPNSGENPLDFSFSGLKTAVLYQVRGQDANREAAAIGNDLPHLAAAFQETVVDVLTRKAIHAANEMQIKQIGVGGGVACNQRLREVLSKKAAAHGLQAFFPAKSLCIDNGAMIAGLGYHLLVAGVNDSFDLDATAR